MTVFKDVMPHDEPGDFYLAIALHDIRRGGITYDISVVYVRIHFTLCTNVYNGIFHLAFPL